MPKYRITVDMPNIGAEGTVEVPPFGVFKNGESKEVDLEEDQVPAFAANAGLSIEPVGSSKRSKGGEQ